MFFSIFLEDYCLGLTYVIIYFYILIILLVFFQIIFFLKRDFTLSRFILVYLVMWFTYLPTPLD